MVQLSKRLCMVADMVTAGNRVADIGCDHAHTSIYLVEKGYSDRVIAMDINEGPLARAQENVKLHGCEACIDIRLSDGIKELRPGEVDTILISGMGGALMLRILEEGKAVVSQEKELILQPQSELASLRKYLHTAEFRIAGEEMLVEDGKYYTAIRAVPGKERYKGETEYRYGKILLEKRNPALYEFLQSGLKKYAQIIEKLKSQEYDRNKERLRELEEECLIMEEALRIYY